MYVVSTSGNTAKDICTSLRDIKFYQMYYKPIDFNLI